MASVEKPSINTCARKTNDSLLPHLSPLGWEHINPLFPRDCMEVEIPLAGGGLWVLQNHFKSKFGGRVKSGKQRKAQASRVAFILAERYDIKKQWVIIAGDFNDTPGSAPLKPRLNNSGLFDTLAAANVSANQRWTYYFGNYILVYPKFKLFDKVYNSLSNADKIIVESPD